MKTALRPGQVTESGFEILEIVELEELEAGDGSPSLGVWARHRKCGTEVFHVFNDDRENLFGFVFTTVPSDASGAAHILEHSVLCGSEGYPLKDAFLVLAQGSLQTFLNAWTFPDKTVYPASSVNERDYFNLMAVYGDAVFRPLLSEWTFMQEGHRLSYGEGEKLEITGVVYNEMKGAYSSLDAYAGLWSIKAVMPDTPYALESGGDPEAIPGLTWEALREFHRAWYAPANCRIFLAGNIPTERQLAFLDERFLSLLPAGAAAGPVPRAGKWTSPRTVRVPCPAGGERKSTVLLSWLCGDAANAAETTALAALTETLLGHDGSPLIRPLIESGLGEDLAPASGLEGELRETVFTLGLRGVSPGEGAAARIETLILGELKRLVSEGVPKEEIEAALLSMEFAHREIRRAGGPYSLVWLRRSLRGWLHGAKPWESLLFMPALGELKKRLASEDRYFESLIEKYLLDNPHRALISLEPEADYLEKKDAGLAARLARREAELSGEEREAIRKKAGELSRIQEQGDSPEALRTIPHLSRRDLSPEIETVPRELRDAGGFPALVHDLFTNGVTYADFAFPLDILSPGDYPWLPLLSRAVVSLGLPGMDYGEVSSLLARTAGGLYATLSTGSPAPGTAAAVAVPPGILDLAGRDWFMLRLKALDEKIGPGMDLALRLFTEADFSDLRRIRDLVWEMKNDAAASLAPGGHTYASGRSNRSLSRSRAVSEVWNGLSQLEFIHTIAEYDTAEISRTLAALRDALAGGAGLIANISASSGAASAALREAESRFRRFGPPRPRNPASRGAAPFLAREEGASDFPRRPGSPAPAGASAPGFPGEVFASPSLRVGFAALSGRAAPFASPEQAAELVLAHRLSTGAFWEDIRMKGGAYGVFAYPDGIEEIFSFSTYRDPDPLRSLEAFPRLLKAAATETPDEESLVKAVIGVYAQETRPRTPADQGAADFFRFLAGIDDRRRGAKLKALVDVPAEALVKAAERLSSRNAPGFPVVVAGTAAAEKAAARLGVPVRKLPV
jgi:Zn-dependent M16 (insulinase) family peptidase